MRRRRGVLVSLALLLTLASGYAWLKAPYANKPSRAVADGFLRLLQEGQVQQAYVLTLGSAGMTGHTLEEFRETARRQLCTRQALALVGLHPLQSNGNRLRRWWRDQDVDMPSITARFEGACLISIELRRDGEGRWRVFNFQSTAG